MTDKVAQPWTEKMAREDRLYHRDMSEVPRLCPGMSYVGENIAMGYTDAAAVMNGWMNSSGHRANILNGNYNVIGLGLAENSSGQKYWTQNFGKK